MTGTVLWVNGMTAESIHLALGIGLQITAYISFACFLILNAERVLIKLKKYARAIRGKIK